ncbi:MAG: DNA-binding protein [Bacteroidales bacterium]|nr:DNA-binding protein [Bacteroidales bacterium]
MKIKNILVSLVAILALAAGCNQVEPDHFLKEVTVSSSYVALNMDGGSATINVVANESWSIPTTPDWLTVSPASGSAGATTVTFSAGKTFDGRTAEIVLKCGDKTQNINVIQGLAMVSPATCAEVIAGPDSKTYRVTGVCTSIANTNYGNWYLQDATGTIYIYGTVDATGKYNWASFGIEVGDKVTVEGPKTTYNGTVELVDASVIKVEKSLIKVAEYDPEDAVLPIEGGIFTVKLTNKGTGLYVDAPADWLTIASISGNTVKFRAAPNEGGDRDAKIVFSTVSGKETYKTELSVSQKGAIIQCSVADFLAAPVGNTQFRMSGIIVGGYASDKSGNSFYIRDWSGETLVYKTDNYAASALRPGDIVTVVGKRGAYKDNPQMVEGTVEAIIDIVEELSISDFLAKPDDKEQHYMVSGVIDEIANESYGNLYLKDDSGNRLYVYGCYPGWGATGDNRKGVVAAKGLKVGDILTVIGPKGTYKDVPQVNGGFYFSHLPAN